MEKLTQTLILDKSTKNTHVYTADGSAGSPPFISNLYISKWVFGTGAVPKRITIDINEDNSETRSV